MIVFGPMIGQLIYMAFWAVFGMGGYFGSIGSIGSQFSQGLLNIIDNTEYDTQSSLVKI